MDIQFYGANCIQINTNKSSLVIDDNIADLGGKLVAKAGDIVISTKSVNNKTTNPMIYISNPGEYEVSNFSIRGISSRAHTDEAGQHTNTVYRIECGDTRIAVVGHIHPDIDDKVLELIGVVDVLIVPVGGGGFTLDPIGAHKVITSISPKIIIPTHYSDSSLNYEVSQISLEEALKTLGDVSERTTKLKLKSTDMPDIAKVIVLDRQTK